MDLMTYQQASKYLNIKVNTLYSMVHHGRISHVRMGPRCVRFRREDLDSMIRDGLRQVC